MLNFDKFSRFSDDARVWVYPSNRPFEDAEVDQIKSDLASFTEEWAAHGNKLYASADVISPHFIVFVVQDDQTLPSGCSIDSSVHFVKSIQTKYNVDFFDRLHVYISSDATIQKIHISELSERDGATKIFDTLISRLGELRNDWPKALAQSNYAKLFS